MKIEPQRTLVGVAVAATLLVTPPTAAYAVDAVDPGIRSLTTR
jgi:hypothetical protein